MVISGLVILVVSLVTKLLKCVLFLGPLRGVYNLFYLFSLGGRRGVELCAQQHPFSLPNIN